MCVILFLGWTSDSDCVNSSHFPLKYRGGFSRAYTSPALWPRHFEVNHAEPRLIKWRGHHNACPGLDTWNQVDPYCPGWSPLLGVETVGPLQVTSPAAPSRAEHVADRRPLMFPSNCIFAQCNLNELVCLIWKAALSKNFKPVTELSSKDTRKAEFLSWEQNFESSSLTITATSGRPFFLSLWHKEEGRPSFA